MSQKLPNMLENTIAKMREMLDSNSVIGTPIQVADNITIIPISTVSAGFAGGGSDFVPKNNNGKENPFGGGAGGGVKVTPLAFLVIKDGSIRMMPIAAPANTTVDRLVEMIPDALDRITDFVDSYKEGKDNKETKAE